MQAVRVDTSIIQAKCADFARTDPIEMTHHASRDTHNEIGQPSFLVVKLCIQQSYVPLSHNGVFQI